MIALLFFRQDHIPMIRLPRQKRHDTGPAHALFARQGDIHPLRQQADAMLCPAGTLTVWPDRARTTSNA